MKFIKEEESTQEWTWARELEQVQGSKPQAANSLTLERSFTHHPTPCPYSEMVEFPHEYCFDNVF